ncbi:MAG: PAS domain S-box protein [bacterium]|nr:PAS domain S-box protein [bacterium]
MQNWRREFQGKVWLWIVISVPAFVVVRVLIWEHFGRQLVREYQLEHLTDFITSLVGASLLVAVVATMAWYFNRLFDRYFDQGYQQLLRQVESERDNYHSLLEGIPAMAWRTDATGKRIYCNQRWLEFTGRSLVEETGENWESVIHTEDLPLYTARLSKAIEGGQSMNLEYRARRYDGKYRWIRDGGRPLREADGRISGFVGVCFDVTEQRDAMQRLRESEERFRAMIETTPDGIIVHRSGIIVYLNSTMRDILRVGRDESLLGQSVLNFVDPEQHLEVIERINRRSDGETHFAPMELRLVKADGTMCDSEITATVIGMDGEPAILVFVRDISDRKDTDRMLAEEAIRRRILIEQSRDGIVVLTETGAVYESNNRFAEMLGYTVEETASLHVWDWDTTWTPEELLEMLRKSDAAGEKFETRMRQKDGSLVDVEITSNGATCNGQKLIFCVCRDISQRNQAEQALRESERMLASLMNNLPGMAFRRQMRPERLLEFASGGSTRIFGYSPEELILCVNSSEMPLIHPGDQGAVERAREEAIESQMPLNVSYRVQHKDGTFRWVMEQASPSSSSDGLQAFLEGIVYDVDEHYRMVLRQSLLNAAIEAADEAIVVTDPLGTIEYCNPAFSRVTGYSTEEAIGKTPAVLKSGKLSSEFYSRLWSTITSGQIWRGELINVAKDGHEFVERATISPVLDSQGKIAHFVAVKHDMTLQRNLEQQLLQSQKLEAVGILAGGIAHDFNNLLTVIIGHSHMLLKHFPEDNPHREDIAQILETGNRAASLTRQLLAYSRKQISRPQSINVNAIIDNLRKMLSRILDENIILTTEFDPHIPHVVIDPAQLEQVILNLVVNARDAMPQGGKITLRTKAILGMAPLLSANDFTDLTAHVQLICSDTGCGMDQATMDRVFDPFFTTKEVGKGTGLGLSTVYGIVHQANGVVTVQSAVGEGTTFEVWLPAEPVSHIEVSPKDKTGQSLIARGSKLVCLVEDEHAIRQLVRRVLEQSGHQVIEASSGEEAIEMLRRREITPDILITDIIMPGMNGRQLGDLVRSRYPGCRSLYMSGYTDDVLGRNGVVGDDCELLQKPFQPEELLAAIDRIIDQPVQPTSRIVEGTVAIVSSGNGSSQQE